MEDKIRARAENPDAATEAAAAARELTVTFNADVNDGMPWRFLPSQQSVKVSIALRPGRLRNARCNLLSCCSLSGTKLVTCTNVMCAAAECCVCDE